MVGHDVGWLERVWRLEMERERERRCAEGETVSGKEHLNTLTSINGLAGELRDPGQVRAGGRDASIRNWGFTRRCWVRSIPRH